MKVRGRLRPEPTDDKQIRILNRLIEWTEDIWYEADPRHAELIIRDMGFGRESKTLCTPGERKVVHEETDRELDTGETTRYRAATARGIELS